MNFIVNVKGLDETIRRLEEYSNRLEQQRDALTRRLADMGAINVSLMFARAIYTGDNDFTVSVEDVEGGYQIVVSGQSVAFVEFGAGITYGAGYPLAIRGAGPGQYPGQKHAFDPNGWYLPKAKRGSNTEDPSGHTYGNPPNMPMYNTAQDLKREIARVAREVFSA